MNKIEVVINPFKLETRVNINGSPISPYSELSKYLKEPFYTWCDKVLDALSRELNDEFSVSIVSRQIEANILQGLSEECDDCVEVSHDNLTIDMPLSTRILKLKEISKISNVDFIEDQINVNLFTYDNLKSNVIDENYKGFSLYNLNISMDLYSKEKLLNRSNEINFVMVTSDAEAQNLYSDIKRENLNLFIIVLNGGSKVTKINNNFICQCDYNDVNEMIMELIEFRYLTPYFVNLLNQVGEKVLDVAPILEDDIKLLKSVEPFVTVSSIESMEINTFCPLKIKSFPENAEIPKLNFKLSNERVVNCDGKNILAIGCGHVDIEVYVQGSLEPTSKFHVNVFKRNKISNVDLEPKTIVFSVGDVKKVDYRFYPENADNQESLHWTTTDSKVATVDKDGNVVGVGPGSCYISISAEEISASCLVSVKSKISNIILSKTSTHLYIGETTNLNMEYTPKDVINNEIICETSDENVAIYKDGVIKATGIGSAVISFVTPDRSVRNSCEIKVSSTFEKNDYRNTPLTISILLFVLSLILLPFKGINKIVPIIGCAFGILAIKRNKKDKGTATLFIILNVVSFIFALINIVDIFL